MIFEPANKLHHLRQGLPSELSLVLLRPTPHLQWPSLDLKNISVEHAGRCRCKPGCRPQIPISAKHAVVWGWRMGVPQGLMSTPRATAMSLSAAVMGADLQMLATSTMPSHCSMQVSTCCFLTASALCFQLILVSRTLLQPVPKCKFHWINSE